MAIASRITKPVESDRYFPSPPKAHRNAFLIWGAIAFTNQTSVNPFPGAKLGSCFVWLMDTDELQIVTDSCSNAVESEIV
jgi:hypothetical protein